jgi:hypothetical protein
VASKSAQPEPVTAEVIEAALEALESTLDRVKVLYEQYFLGIQKQPPQFMHTDVERKLRDLAQVQIRNTALRYRLATVQQKYGSYNTYWRRTLRQIEAGTYHRSLHKLTRQAASTGTEIPEEILAAMPKRMQEQVRRDRAAALAQQRRRAAEAAPIDDAELLTLAPLRPGAGGVEAGDDDDDAGFVREPSELRRSALRAQPALHTPELHVIEEADADFDVDAFFDSIQVADAPAAAPPRAGSASRQPAELARADPARAARTTGPTPSRSWLATGEVGAAPARARTGERGSWAAAAAEAAPERAGDSGQWALREAGAPGRAAVDAGGRAARAATAALDRAEAARGGRAAAPLGPRGRAIAPETPAPAPTGRTRPDSGRSRRATESGPAGAARPGARTPPPRQGTAPGLPAAPPPRVASLTPAAAPVTPAAAPLTPAAAPLTSAPPALPSGRAAAPAAPPAPSAPAVPDPPRRTGAVPPAIPRPPAAIPPIPSPGRPPLAGAPSQQARPLPIAPGAAIAQGEVPVESLAGPFARAPAPGGAPAPSPAGPRRIPSIPVPPVPPRPASAAVPRVPPRAAMAPGAGRGQGEPGAAPPPGMTAADVEALYARYVKAKQMVGEPAGPNAYAKLMKTIHAQAPKIMEQYKAQGVDFSVVVKDNQVVIRAKPKP